MLINDPAFAAGHRRRKTRSCRDSSILHPRRCRGRGMNARGGSRGRRYEVATRRRRGGAIVRVCRTRWFRQPIVVRLPIGNAARARDHQISLIAAQREKANHDGRRARQIESPEHRRQTSRGHWTRRINCCRSVRALDQFGATHLLKGDQIFNGRVGKLDAERSLGLFLLARRQPSAQILFLSVTAEEKGLLGAKYYASNPLYPLTQTVANINMDGINQWGTVATSP